MSSIIRSTLTVLFLARCATAVPVASNQIAGANGGNFFWGQAFTVLAAGPVNNVIINFFGNTPPTNPLALGTGFILSSEYLGTPLALSGATPGFLGSAVGDGAHWTFNSSLTLLANTQYFFYSNGAMPPSASNGNQYAGGNSYLSVSSNTNFFDLGQDLNFLVDATLAPVVPEIDTHSAAPAFAAVFCLLNLLGSATAGRRRQVGVPIKG